MNFIIILLGVAMIVLSALGIIPIPYWIGLVVVGAALILPSITSALGVFGTNTPKEGADGKFRDSCGCQAGQKASVDKKNFWGNFKFHGEYRCSDALQLIRSKPKRYRLGACSF
jgi:hypothetical protein